MTYVMSDLHGMYGLYKDMLAHVKFTDEDSLYILGDICDRGDDAARIYMDVMERKNVFCIKGNHEMMLQAALPSAMGWSEEDGEIQYIWDTNGGDTTKLSLHRFCTEQEIRRIHSFVSDLPYYREIEINGKKFTLAHAGGYDENGAKHISELDPHEIVWDSPDFGGVYGDRESEMLIVGHTPTLLISRSPMARIYHGEGNIIDVDCGAVFSASGGRLGCLCLETMGEFYVF